jgi:hypothetical protein
MQLPDQRGRLTDALWLLCWGVLSSAWCLTAAERLSATFDEPTYLRVGLERWRTGSTGGLLRLGTMPLPVDVQTLPLAVWERLRGAPFDAAADQPRLLPWARAANLVFWWLLLFYALRAGRSLAGPWAGRLAVAVLACEPSLLAHAALATTDLAVTACLLALVYHFHVGREHDWKRRVGVPALWLAAATLAKASGLVFGVLCLVAVEVQQRFVPRIDLLDVGSRRMDCPSVPQAPGLTHPGVSFRRELIQIVGLALAGVFLYCGSDWQPVNDLVAWAHGLPPGPGARVAVAVAEGLRIFPNAGYAFVRQVAHNVRGHGVYLLGHTHRRALWYYFPVLLTIKLTVPLLVLTAVLLLRGRPALRNWACAAAGALLLFSVACRVQIGVRFMLPLVALAAVGLCAAAVLALRGTGPRPRRAFAVLLAGGVAWSAAAAVGAWPHGLAYVNELWGGMESGYRVVDDSNYDWGQGLKDLARWQGEHGGELFVWYFGLDPTADTPPFHPVRLHCPKDVPWPAATLEELAGRRLAVSTTFLYHPAPTPAVAADQAYLRSLTPVGRTLTFLIYDLPPGDLRAARPTP